MGNTTAQSLLGWPIGIVRFAIFVPFGVYYGTAHDHWKNIRSHLVLHDLSHNLFRAEHVAARWAKIGFYWNFSVWLPAWILPAPFTLIFAAFDAVITTYMAIATHLQTISVPHSFGKCKFGGAAEWQIDNKNESFFAAAGRLNATKASAERMCRDYVEEWQYGVALTFFYTFISLWGISMSIVACSQILDQNRRTNRSLKAWFKEDALAYVAIIPLLIARIVLLFIYYLPRFVFRCLPLGVKSRVRYTGRYAAKGAQRVPVHDIKLAVMNRESSKPQYKPSSEGKSSSLAEFLIYDILVLVAQNLHYVDLVNLSSTSKTMREVVFPSEDRNTLDHFKMYTCDPNTRTTCWNCRNQICELCGFKCYLKETRLTFHQDACVPWCNKCYVQGVQRLPRRPRVVGDLKCACAPKRPPNFLEKVWYGNRYYNEAMKRPKTHSPFVCRMCFYDVQSQPEVRDQRTRYELRNPKDALRCENCRLVLGKGPRWWVCRRCNKECCSMLHEPWGKKKLRRDEEDEAGI